jgi:hypothetical protein
MKIEKFNENNTISLDDDKDFDGNLDKHVKEIIIVYMNASEFYTLQEIFEEYFKQNSIPSIVSWELKPLIKKELQIMINQLKNVDLT